MTALKAPVANASTLPHDFETEQALLGAILVNNDAFERVARVVNSEHFFEPLHQRIFEACAKMVRAGKIASIATLKGHFALDVAMQEMGGADYLVQLARFSPSVINAIDYAILVRDMADRRAIIYAATDAIATAQDPPVDQAAVDVLRAHETALGGLAINEQREGVVSAGKAASDVTTDLERQIATPGLIGLSTGFRDWDEQIGGLRPGTLVVIGARPGTGKSVIGAAVGFNVARAGGGVLYLSLEMSARELLVREMSAETYRAGDGVQYRDILAGKVSGDQFARVCEAEQAVRGLPLHILDSGGLSAEAAASEIKRYARTARTSHCPLQAVVIDHLHLMKMDNPRDPNTSIGLITARLKQVAKDLQITVILLAQLNRESEKRSTRKVDDVYSGRPIISDLRGSGAIEQDADIIALLFRPEQQGDSLEPKRVAFDVDEKYTDAYNTWVRAMGRYRKRLEVYIEKNRMGTGGQVTLACNIAYSHLADFGANHGAD
jgi:replicative DNA helicase